VGTVNGTSTGTDIGNGVIAGITLAAGNNAINYDFS
jgi:hypothetical protein